MLYPKSVNVENVQSRESTEWYLNTMGSVTKISILRDMSY